MAKYRNSLPQMAGDLFLTDGGIETTLIFHQGLELPLFAAFVLLNDEAGKAELRKYYLPYCQLARDRGVGFVLESATWRANSDWARELDYSKAALDEANRAAISEMVALREEFETETSKMVISGCIGPRGDGYSPDNMMTPEQAQQYHAQQVNTFKETVADMVTAITMNYVEEAIGLTRAAQGAGMPVVISFTVETDGCLPTGQSLKDAVHAVDGATGNGPVYYMINCAHPSHFDFVLETGDTWLERIGGLRANASKLSHAELDEAEELDDGNPTDLGNDYKILKTKLPRLNVMGGCCGTDHRHIAAICDAVREQHGSGYVLSGT